MKEMNLKNVGVVKRTGDGFVIKIDKAYKAGLRGLEGFGHINVLWWFSKCDDLVARSVLETERPYRDGPDRLGVFASRSPERPNPIALTVSEVMDINYETGELRVAFIDAEDGTPVLDIKPYIPSFDRVMTPRVPRWQGGWPMSSEESGSFDWDEVFNF